MMREPRLAPHPFLSLTNVSKLQFAFIFVGAYATLTCAESYLDKNWGAKIHMYFAIISHIIFKSNTIQLQRVI